MKIMLIQVTQTIIMMTAVFAMIMFFRADKYSQSRKLNKRLWRRLNSKTRILQEQQANLEEARIYFEKQANYIENLQNEKKHLEDTLQLYRAEQYKKNNLIKT